MGTLACNLTSSYMEGSFFQVSVKLQKPKGISTNQLVVTLPSEL